MAVASGRAGAPAEFLLIETRAAATVDGAGFSQDALLQAQAGHNVLLLLIQDGVTLAMPGRSAEVEALIATGARVLADGFSLAQRGLERSALLPGTEVTELAAVADALLDPAVKVVWH
ncbi:hypothetical protein ACIGXA_10150 [Streptomyces fildesensis]|uniref:DsrE/DsrF-like family protein n=1 Tax=Streptomyces fildesensis TaxID=375757 RepID=A0ABW8C375_9ACTN